MTSRSFRFRQDFVWQERNMAAVRVYGLFNPGDVYTFVTDYNLRQMYTVNGRDQGMYNLRHMYTVNDRDQGMKNLYIR